MSLNESYKKRIQELAGIQLPKTEAITLAKGFKEFEKEMGQGSINNLLNYMAKELKQPFVPSSIEEDKITFSTPNGYFLLFRGYMVDISSYEFNIGYKNKMGQEIFTHQIQFDMSGTPSNLKSLNFSS